ncbi:MAG: sulfatase-like hydrolase/transferase, partial [Myxococcota bacterium]
FTSDHGEGFGEKKFWRHGVELWEPLVRVPLVVQTPGVRPHRVKARRSHIDLVPTMLEILNLPRATGEGFDFTSGVSLGPDLLLEPGAEAASRSVMVDMPAGPYNGARRAFIHGDLKLVISRNSKKELFDLNEDPGELRNQWGTRKKEIEAFYALAKKKLRPVKVDKTKK